MQQADGKFEDEKKKLDEANKAHKQKEESLKRGIESLKRTKDRLLEVKTNKEYQAMLKEIEIFHKKNSECEDEVIYALEEIDQIKKDLKERQHERDEFRQIHDRDMQKINEEISTIDQDIGHLVRKRESVQEGIQKDVLRQYEMIKSKRNGRAVVSVVKGICAGCYMNIPPQMFIELQKSDELMTCPFCSRIIYWEQKEPDGK